MYTFEPPILYPEDALRGAYFLRSAPKKFSLIVLHTRCMVPLGLFLVAFPPPPVTFPATRLIVLRRVRERRSTHLADHFQRALLVFIRTTRSVPKNSSSKPFGFGSGRTGQRLSAPSVLKRLRHHIRSTSRCRSKCP